VSVGRDADRVEAEPAGARAPAGGDEQAVAAQLAAGALDRAAGWQGGVICCPSPRWPVLPSAW
jgi:hypothetical protein